MSDETKRSVQYPELAKVQAARDRGSETVAEFYDWLRRRGYIICGGPGGELKFVEGAVPDVAYLPALASKDTLLNAFFEIDQHKVDAEKEQVLEAIRESWR